MKVTERLHSADTIRTAALHAFHERGYHGTSVRDIARRSGLSVAALYHHYESKQQMLVELVHRYMDALLAELLRAHAEAPLGPRSRLAAMVHAHVTYHLEHPEMARVGNSEIRRLNPTDAAAVIEKRDRETALFAGVVQAGVDSGDFAVEHPREAVRAILEMCVAVLDWYEDYQGKRPGDVAESYVQMALNIVRAGPAPD